jgi:hypothetical protein
MKEDDCVIQSLQNLNISVDNLHSSGIFIINNDLDITENYFITSINLNFYQIWSIFNTLPRIHKSGKCKYEWRFQKSKDDDEPIFCIYDWNNPKSLLQTKKWYIGCNTNDQDKIAEFLKILGDAIECYNLYYKCIEKHIFINTKYSIVHKRLQEIKLSIINNRELLKNL